MRGCALAARAKHVGQHCTQVAGYQQAAGAQTYQFTRQRSRAHQQASLAAAFYVHDRAHVERQVQHLLGKGVGLHRLAAVHEKNLAFAILGNGRNGIVRPTGRPEYAPVGVDHAVVLDNQRIPLHLLPPQGVIAVDNGRQGQARLVGPGHKKSTEPLHNAAIVGVVALTHIARAG